MCLTALVAQKKQPAPAVFPLEAVHVDGNQKLTADKILAVAALKIGEPVIRTDFDQARKRLLATGAFQSVAYEFKPSADAKGVDGTLHVIEVDAWFPYHFEDLPATDETLRAMLRKQELILGDQIPATREVIARYTAAIEEFLDGKAITPETLRDMATVAAGEVSVVSDFRGDEAYRRDMIRVVLARTAAPLFNVPL